MENKAYTHIFNDILSKVLELSESPSQFAEYLTHQIRELIGAKTIVISIKPESGEAHILNVYPERKNNWASQSQMIQLAELSFGYDTVQFLSQETCDKQTNSILTDLEIDKLITIPLIIGNRKVGSLLLLDIMDLFGIESMIDLLTNLSGVFALVIRNSLLYRDMENVVELRTTELQKRNDELEKAVRRAEQSELQARDILQTAMDGFWLVDMNGRFLEVNEIACSMLGYSYEEMKGMSISDVEAVETPEQTMSHLKQVSQIGQAKFESKHRCKNGSIINVEVSVKMQPYKELFVAFISDITERKNAETALRESDDRFQLAMKASNDGLFDWNLETNGIYYSPGWKKMLGYEDHELPNDFSVWENTTNPEDVKKSWEMQQKLIKKEVDRFVMEFKMQHKNGHWVDILSRAEAFFNTDGKAIRIVGTHTDITERNKAEKQIVEINEMLSQYLKNSPIYTYIKEVSPERSTVLQASDNFIDMVGISGSDMIGKDMEELFPPEFAKKITSDDWMVACGTKAIKIEEELNGKSYTTIKFPFKRGGKTLLAGYTIDITENKKAQLEIQETEERWRRAIADSPIPIMIHDEDDRVLQLSAGWTKFSGYTIDDIPTLSDWTERAYGERSGFKKDYLDQLFFIDKTVDNGEWAITAKDGTTKIWAFQTTPLGKIHGGKRVLHSMALDITERKRAEEEVRESEQRFLTFMNNSSVFAWMKDEDLKYVFLNKAFENQQGITLKDVQGKDDFAIWNEQIAEKLQSNDRKVLSSGEILKTEEIVEDRFGQLKHSMVNKFLVQGLSGKRFIGGISIDITEQKIMEADLILSKEKAEENDRLKSAFLANMSHEIRTPMNGILGFAELLKEQDLSGEQQLEYIQVIQKSGVRMLNIINDIVDISKIESGQMNILLSETNVNEQLEYLFKFFGAEANNKGVHLICKNELKRQVANFVTDREKLYAILTNLIKNAIKYTDEGTIEFGYEFVESSEASSPHELKFYVKDTGIGIPKNRQEAIFERFIQADIIDKMARQGAGLGLAISKAYVEMLGGKIWTESEEGKGSVFYFTLPDQTNSIQSKKNGDASQNQAEIDQLKKLKILIAEDDQPSGKLISIVMQKFAKEIVLVTSGLEAVDFCKKNKDIDLVLMDIQMPDMDGYAATRLIREFNKDTIIISQTAYALSGDREKAIAAGCNDYISKPIKKEELKSMILKHFNKQLNSNVL